MTVPETGLHLDLQLPQIPLRLSALPLGNDLSIAIHGGDRGHIGAVAVAVPHPSLSDPDQFRATTSLITVMGHREDELARQVADRLATTLRVTVTVACGIHVDNIAIEQIRQIEQAVQALTGQLIQHCRNAD